MAEFHELGHALNHSSKLSRMLQKTRVLQHAAIVFMCLGLVTNKKSKDSNLNPFEKTINFIHNNMGKLIFLAYTPLIAEEILASIKGCKLAKSHLNKELYKKVVTASKAAGATYVLFATSTALSAAAGMWTKDKLIDKMQRRK